MTSGNAAMRPEELLSDLDRLRRQARTDRHAYWFPLVLFGLLTCASVPFYVSYVTQIAPGRAVMWATAPPTLLGGMQAGRNGLLLGWYWALALIAGYLLTYAWYRWHTRRVGLRTPARCLRHHRHRAGRAGLPRPAARRQPVVALRAGGPARRGPVGARHVRVPDRRGRPVGARLGRAEPGARAHR